jgi:hypothetical protein
MLQTERFRPSGLWITGEFVPDNSVPPGEGLEEKIKNKE